MIDEVRLYVDNRFITQDEALIILVQGPYKAQLYLMNGGLITNRYRLDLSRSDKLIMRLDAKSPKDLFDAVLLPEEARPALLAGVKEQRYPWIYGKW